MRRIFYICILLFLSLFIACEKEERGDLILEGSWYVRTNFEEFFSDGAFQNFFYNSFTRSEINERYIKFDFRKDGQLIVEQFVHSSRESLTRTQYAYHKENGNLIFNASDGQTKIFKYSFTGLSSKSLKLEGSQSLLYNNNTGKIKKTIITLLRELPLADPESDLVEESPSTGVPSEAP